MDWFVVESICRCGRSSETIQPRRIRPLHTRHEPFPQRSGRSRIQAARRLRSLARSEIRNSHPPRHSKIRRRKKSAHCRLQLSRERCCRHVGRLSVDQRQLWNEHLSPAAAAYYDSIAKLYASWGVDFLKVDCIASHPYRGEDIRLISEALEKSGRPIVLSLSPGPAPLEKADELRQYAQMWRISDDIWDVWHSDQPFPQGLGDQFANVAKWALQGQPGHWPDADMLALGYLGPHPGSGEPRKTRFTHDEQRALVSLWAIARSPLMVGGELPSADAWTEALLTNREVIAVDQHSQGNHPVIATADTTSWLASWSPRAIFISQSSTCRTRSAECSTLGATRFVRRPLRRTRSVGSEKIRQCHRFSRHTRAAWRRPV